MLLDPTRVPKNHRRFRSRKNINASARNSIPWIFKPCLQRVGGDFQESERLHRAVAVPNEPNGAVPLRTMVFTMVFPVRKLPSSTRTSPTFRVLRCWGSSSPKIHCMAPQCHPFLVEESGSELFFEPESKSSKTETNKRTTQSTSHLM